MLREGAPAFSADSMWVASLFAVDPSGLVGVVLRAPAGDARDAWVAQFRDLLPADTPWRRIPHHTSDAALLGGLDLAATLQAGRPVAQQGLLALADGGVIVLPMAERLPAGRAAQLAVVLDAGELAVEREGFSQKRPSRLGVLALDEGQAEDEKVPSSLLDRSAFHLRLELADPHDSGGLPPPLSAMEVAKARQMLTRVNCEDEVVKAVCAAAMALGIDSLRAPLLAIRAARAVAALHGDVQVQADHAAIAVRLVLGPRATQIPAPPPSPESDDAEAAQDLPEPPSPEPEQASEPHSSADEQPAPPSEAPAPEDDQDRNADELQLPDDQTLAETVMAAAQAAIPEGLLAGLKVGGSNTSRVVAGRSGAAQKGQARGRPIGVRRGEPRGGARLNVIETLRAAAPWQRLRQAQIDQTRKANASPPVSPAATARPAPRVLVQREDFHVTRVRQLRQTTTVFVVDASGSAALNRLAETKGAVELLLADCYVRRDRVAVLAFRGAGAELLLPPTRSLARAKRSLAGLPGGGGTPLAAGIVAAYQLAENIKRRGETPIIVLLTDGRANIARDGAPGRARATEDAQAAARQLRIGGFTALLLDTSPQPQASARALAQDMGAAYLPLPYAGAQLVSQAVRAATDTSSR